MLIVAASERCQFRGNHCSLRRIQMPAPQVEANDIGNRIRALVSFESRFDTGLNAGAITVAAVKDLALMQNDGFMDPVRVDILDQRLEVFAFSSGKRFARG